MGSDPKGKAFVIMGVSGAGKSWMEFSSWDLIIFLAHNALSNYKEVDRSASLLSELERLGWEVTIRWESYVVLFPLRRPARSSPDVELLPSS
ncbi:hypothetical protein Pint_21617 [Pistacia integerrima]|uniref:Uncharacterized protein n=1 Tax=Pistacia integerrima TaxID=434235 RepID=A0ACC0X9X8_9ROSI|nr:hypothetical protein Pint_21617 [Pistacia integerrima]